MNRWLMIGSMVGLLFTATGCLRHNVRQDCNTCQSGNCSSGNCNSDCESCNGGRSGVFSRMGGSDCGCGNGCRTGCPAGPIGWQQGGLDYSSHLNPGLLGHNTSSAIQSQGFQPGPPSAQVAYPYYSHRGPRDFLLDNPPSIGR